VLIEEQGAKSKEQRSMNRATAYSLLPASTYLRKSAELPGAVYLRQEYGSKTQPARSITHSKIPENLRILRETNLQPTAYSLKFYYQ